MFDPAFGKDTHTFSVTFFGSSPTVSFSNNHVSRRPHFFAIFACVSNISSSLRNPMSITINNYLISIHFPLGGKIDDDNRVRMLVNTGATMNSGHLNYHLWVIS